MEVPDIGLKLVDNKYLENISQKRALVLDLDTDIFEDEILQKEGFNRKSFNTRIHKTISRRGLTMYDHLSISGGIIMQIKNAINFNDKERIAEHISHLYKNVAKIVDSKFEALEKTEMLNAIFRKSGEFVTQKLYDEVDRVGDPKIVSVINTLK